MTTGRAQLIDTAKLERLVELGEYHGARYDAFGDEEDLRLAVEYEKAAFELRNSTTEAIPAA